MRSERITIGVGDRFGSLVIVREGKPRPKGSRGVRRYFHCLCDCGNEVEVRMSHLRSGHTQSCGCFQGARSASQKHQAGYHGMSGSPEYGIWKGMKKRCCQSSRKDYPNYGGCGITVCDKWRSSFAAFFTDMGLRPTPKHSIDRIDGTGNYEPDNCRWATSAEQNRNRSDNCNLTFEGETMCQSDWAERYGLTKTTLWCRLKKGWSIKDALTKPARQKRTDSEFLDTPAVERDWEWGRECKRRGLAVQV